MFHACTSQTHADWGWHVTPPPSGVDPDSSRRRSRARPHGALPCHGRRAGRQIQLAASQDTASRCCASSSAATPPQRSRRSAPPTSRRLIRRSTCGMGRCARRSRSTAPPPSPSSPPSTRVSTPSARASARPRCAAAASASASPSRTPRLTSMVAPTGDPTPTAFTCPSSCRRPRRAAAGGGACDAAPVLRHTLDNSTSYYVHLALGGGGCLAAGKVPHDWLVFANSSATATVEEAEAEEDDGDDEACLELTAWLSPNRVEQRAPPSASEVIAAAAAHGLASGRAARRSSCRAARRAARRRSRRAWCARSGLRCRRRREQPNAGDGPNDQLVVRQVPRRDALDPPGAPPAVGAGRPRAQGRSATTTRCASRRGATRASHRTTRACAGPRWWAHRS